MSAEVGAPIALAAARDAVCHGNVGHIYFVIYDPLSSEIFCGFGYDDCGQDVASFVSLEAQEF